VQYEAEIRIVRGDAETLAADFRAVTDFLERRREERQGRGPENAIRVAERIARQQDAA
jgi:hypothetical protein